MTSLEQKLQQLNLAAMSHQIEQTISERAVNLIEWTSAGVTYWAASDLNLAELREFVRLL